MWLVPNHLKKQGGHRLIKFNNFFLQMSKVEAGKALSKLDSVFSLWPFPKDLAKCMVGGIVANKSSFSALSGPPSPWGPAHVHGI